MTQTQGIRSPFLAQTLQELQTLKANGPQSAYRAALVVSAPSLVDAMMERLQELENSTINTRDLCETVADWLWIRILGWCQIHEMQDDVRENLFNLVESIKQGAPLLNTCEPLSGVQDIRSASVGAPSNDSNG